jgi:hypothetical protein
MMFNERIKQLRENLQIPQRKLAAELEELLTLWLAEQVTDVMADDKDLLGKVLNIAKEKH